MSNNPVLPRFLNSVARLRHRQNDAVTDVAARRRINWVDTATITWTVTDDSVDEEVDVSGVASGATPGGAAGGDLTGSYPNPTLAAAGPGATGPIGDATHTPTVTIDAKGRTTGLTSTLITGVVPAFAAPALTLGTANAAGSASTAVRTDATLLAFDATAPTTSAVGDAAAAGTATVAARRDHTHGREAFATPAIVLGSAAAAGSATTHIRSDGTIAAFDTTVPTTQAMGDAAAIGTIAFAARRDHKHAMPAYGSSAGTVTQGNDSRLSDSRAPNGSAGGDLTGTYPNPTLAVSGGPAWTSWSPTITSSVGTITTVGTVLALYLKIGRTVHWRANITITTNGTGSGVIQVPLPFNAAALQSIGSGRENAVTGKQLQVWSSTSPASVQFYDGTYPGANNAQLLIGGVYEASS